MKMTLSLLLLLPLISFARPNSEAKAKIDAACESDFATYCAGKERREKRNCIHENKDKFSSGCQTVLEEMKPPHPRGERPRK